MVEHALLEVKDLRTSVRARGRDVDLIQIDELVIGRGEIVGIVGESGSGKSITALSILGLAARRPGFSSRGKVLFEGEDLLRLSESDLRHIRGARIGMVFQDATAHLDPLARAGDAVVEALQVHQRLNRQDARERTEDLLRTLKVPAPAAAMRSFPHQLSGGMCQRVLIATAISCEPSLLIADEATSGLDATVQASILETIRGLRARNGMSVLLTTHDIRLVQRLCDRVLVMYGGRIIETGPVMDVLTAPKHPYTAGLVASIPAFAPHHGQLRPIAGEPPTAGIRTALCPFRPRCPIARDLCDQVPIALQALARGRSTACHFPDEVGADAYVA
jgi:oligopeptide/dipeptide ABC transporter ATP-binding protein